jgi:2-dehydro-3-deoxygalactonokinase
VNEPATLLALDWGTSALRGALLDAEGQVIEERAFDRGIHTVAPGAFQAVFIECFGDWLDVRAPHCLIAGMAGSRQGWQEAPYCPCPAGFDELGRHLHWIAPGRIAIVPGLSCHPETGVPDVMRGEEVQIFGALQLSALSEGLFVLPGTHSKWALVRDGRVTGFRTYMTGEFYALLAHQSLLARTVEADAPFDGTAFADGVRRARQGPSLLHTAFGARTRALFGLSNAAALASYLSGLVIGEELRAQADTAQMLQAPLQVIGSAALCLRYAAACQVLGWPCQVHDATVGWAGLHALSRTIAWS